MLRLVNRYEETTYSEIRAVADRYGLSVYPKVRVADVLRLDRFPDMPVSLWSYGLKAHFDFVVCRDQWVPEYVVEFDGPSHQSTVQIERDAKKDALCRMYTCPLLRVNSNHIDKKYGTRSLLAWIAEVYELSLGFYEAQATGQIPWDEPFDPFFLSVGDERYPLWLSASHRVRLRDLHTNGLVVDPCTSGRIGRDDSGNLHGIEYVRLNEDEGLVVQTAMRPQQFPVMLSDLLGEILFIQLMQKLDSFLAGAVPSTRLVKIDGLLKSHARYKLIRSHWIGATSEAGD